MIAGGGGITVVASGRFTLLSPSIEQDSATFDLFNSKQLMPLTLKTHDGMPAFLMLQEAVFKIFMSNFLLQHTFLNTFTRIFLFAVIKFH